MLVYTRIDCVHVVCLSYCKPGFTNIQSGFGKSRVHGLGVKYACRGESAAEVARGRKLPASR